jgi:hypothetical protein
VSSHGRELRAAHRARCMPPTEFCVLCGGASFRGKRTDPSGRFGAVSWHPRMSPTGRYGELFIATPTRRPTAKTGRREAAARAGLPQPVESTNQGREWLLHELRRRHHQMGSAVPPGRLESQQHQTCSIGLHPFTGQSRTGDVAAQTAANTSPSAPQ